MIIKSLTIKGYRSIQDLHLTMGHINVITGANGAGKSNLYKSIYLLAKAVDGALAKTLAQEGGMPSILWAGKKNSTTTKNPPARLTLQIETDSINYELTCGLPQISSSLFSLDPIIKEEYVWSGQDRRKSNTLLERQSSTAWVTNIDNERVAYPVNLSPSESVLSQLKDPHLYPELFYLNSEIKRWRFYHYFQTDPQSPLRRPQVGVRTDVLHHDGHDLACALQTIIEIGDRELLHASIESAFPGAQLIISVDNKMQFEVQLQMPDILRPLEARELSDGTLRYLCLVAALLSPRPSPMIALNEPEMSLHPELIPPLAALIVTASKRSQIWVTTHSLQLANLIQDYSGVDSINLHQTSHGTAVSE